MTVAFIDHVHSNQMDIESMILEQDTSYHLDKLCEETRNRMQGRSTMVFRVYNLGIVDSELL